MVKSKKKINGSVIFSFVIDIIPDVSRWSRCNEYELKLPKNFAIKIGAEVIIAE